MDSDRSTSLEHIGVGVFVDLGVLENFEGFLEDIGVEKASGTGISKSKQGSIGPWPLGLLLRVLVVLGVSMVTGTS